MIESVANTSSFTGQAVIASLRQGKNQPFLQAVGIETNNDVPSDPVPLPPLPDNVNVCPKVTEVEFNVRDVDWFALLMVIVSEDEAAAY
jgi:hypothetical protein